MTLCNTIRFTSMLLLSVAAATSIEAMASSPSQVIYDYPLAVATIEVEPSDRETLTELEPVVLQLAGTVETTSRTRQISGGVEGVSLPYRNIDGVRRYLLLLRSGNVIYTENGREVGDAIGEVDGDGRLVPYPQWSWQVTYREYRYTLADRILGLIGGTRFRNQEELSVELDPR